MHARTHADARAYINTRTHTLIGVRRSTSRTWSARRRRRRSASRRRRAGRSARTGRPSRRCWRCTGGHLRRGRSTSGPACGLCSSCVAWIRLRVAGAAAVWHVHMGRNAGGCAHALCLLCGTRVGSGTAGAVAVWLRQVRGTGRCVAQAGAWHRQARGTGRRVAQACAWHRQARGTGRRVAQAGAWQAQGRLLHCAGGGASGICRRIASAAVLQARLLCGTGSCMAGAVAVSRGQQPRLCAYHKPFIDGGLDLLYAVKTSARILEVCTQKADPTMKASSKGSSALGSVVLVGLICARMHALVLKCVRASMLVYALGAAV